MTENKQFSPAGEKDWENRRKIIEEEICKNCNHKLMWSIKEDCWYHISNDNDVCANAQAKSEETFESYYNFLVKNAHACIDFSVAERFKQLHDQRIKEIIKARHEIYCDMVIEKDAEIKELQAENEKLIIENMDYRMRIDELYREIERLKQ